MKSLNTLSIWLKSAAFPELYTSWGIERGGTLVWAALGYPLCDQIAAGIQSTRLKDNCSKEVENVGWD